MLSLDQLEERIGYAFQNKKLLDRARTHRSFSADHNERLEFLGDSVLNCVIGNALFLRDRHFTEGDLSRVRANLVCEKMLNTIGRRVGVSNFLRMGEGEMRTGGAERPSIIADAMEAIFGAVFAEAGFEAAQEVILRLYEPILTGLTPEQLSKDPKTRLQEMLQGLHLPRPEYDIVEVRGLAHDQTFVTSCRIASMQVETTGTASSRRGAEQEAARKALEILSERDLRRYRK